MKAVKEINFLSHIFQKTVFHRERTVFWIWMSSGLIYAIVKLLIGKYNNYKIFENVFPHVINGLHLYVEYPTEYYDVNHYGPIFALVIAPFSILPEWLGMIFWILMNTYFLFYAIRQLPFNESQRIIVYWYSLCELMTAQGVQQFNISVAAFIILSFFQNTNCVLYFPAFFGDVCFWFCRYSSLRGQIIFLRNILRGWNDWKSKMASICSPYLKIFLY